MSPSDSSGYFPAMRTSALGKLEPQALPAEGSSAAHSSEQPANRVSQVTAE